VAVADVAETCFAETPGGRIAYQVVGDGPIDVLVSHGPFFPIDLMWDEPSLVRFVDRLSTFSRHVWFDPRGRGASDPLAHMEERFAETIVDDMLAVVDHLGLERVALVGDSPHQLLFAASHPERTKALVMLNAGPRVANFREPTTDVLEQMYRGWGTGASLAGWPPAWPATLGSGDGWGAASGCCARPTRCTGGEELPSPWTCARRCPRSTRRPCSCTAMA
jgi:pimeloyl-ACP methyl ester carboxylesterase